MKKTIPLLASVAVELCLAAPLVAATARTATENFVTNKIAAAISQIPPPDFSTNNVALVETIEATAPAPGNYAAVSNAAVYAAITNALQDTAIAGKADREIVIGQMKGLPGDCFPIAYVYNGGSYSIVNSGGIVVDQFGPAYYRLADSVTGVAVCYFRISDGTYFSNAEASGITFGGTAPTQLAWPVLGDVPKKSPVVYDVDIKTNYYDKTETEAKIVELAPAPGDYAAVSNAAMTALSRAEAEAGFTEWKFTPPDEDGKMFSTRYIDNEWRLYLGDTFTEFVDDSPADSTELSWDLGATTATRVRLPTMADIPTAQINAATNYTAAVALAATNYTAAVALAATNYTNASISPTSPAFSNAVSNVISTAYVREKLGVWMEYDEATGLYYYCHEEE